MKYEVFFTSDYTYIVVYYYCTIMFSSHYIFYYCTISIRNIFLIQSTKAANSRRPSAKQLMLGSVGLFGSHVPTPQKLPSGNPSGKWLWFPKKVWSPAILCKINQQATTPKLKCEEQDADVLVLMFKLRMASTRSQYKQKEINSPHFCTSMHIQVQICKSIV